MSDSDKDPEAEALRRLARELARRDIISETANNGGRENAAAAQTRSFMAGTSTRRPDPPSRQGNSVPEDDDD